MADEYTLSDEEREAVLDWMELPNKSQVYAAVAKWLAERDAETRRKALLEAQCYVDAVRADPKYGHDAQWVAVNLAGMTSALAEGGENRVR